VEFLWNYPPCCYWFSHWKNFLVNNKWEISLYCVVFMQLNDKSSKKCCILYYSSPKPSCFTVLLCVCCHACTPEKRGTPKTKQKNFLLFSLVFLALDISSWSPLFILASSMSYIYADIKKIQRNWPTWERVSA
jgi:hypothetical protein